MRSGFTLIEALVALVLFQIAALALAATTAVAARDLAVANRHTRANVVARDRVARVQSSACATPSAGSQEHPGGLRERWGVEVDGPLRIITDSVTIALPRGRVGSVVIRAWEICP